MELYEQTALDMTLDSELPLKLNVEKLVAFATANIVNSVCPPTPVKNRHEAYGIAAENFAAVNGAAKQIKTALETLLNTLPDPNYPAVEAVSSLCAASNKAAVIAITMAAEMRRTLTDLYQAETEEQSALTPLEEYMEAQALEDGDPEEEAESPDADEITEEE